MLRTCIYFWSKQLFVELQNNDPGAQLPLSSDAGWWLNQAEGYSGLKFSAEQPGRYQNRPGSGPVISRVVAHVDEAGSDYL